MTKITLKNGINYLKTEYGCTKIVVKGEAKILLNDEVIIVGIIINYAKKKKNNKVYYH